MKKRVFSCEKFAIWALQGGYSCRQIFESLERWGYQCEGLTEKEMEKLGFSCLKQWLKNVEVPWFD